MDVEKHTLKQWEEIAGVEILDPDGFDRSDEHLYERMFTEEQFMRGLAVSTVADVVAVAEYFERQQPQGVSHED